MRNKKTNIKTTPFLPAFPGPTLLHSRLLFPPAERYRGDGEWGLGSVHNGFPLPLLPSHTSPLLQNGLAAVAAVLQEKNLLCCGFSTGHSPSRTYPACSGVGPPWAAVGTGYGLLLTKSCRGVSALACGAPPPLILVFPLLFPTLSVPCSSACTAFLNCIFSKVPPFWLRGSAVSCCGSAGVGWNCLCPAQGSPSLSTPRPPLQPPHC